MAAVAAYVGYRAYKKHYPFEELMSKGKSSRKEEANVPADKVDEIPIEKGIRVFNWEMFNQLFFIVTDSDSEDKLISEQVSAVN